MIPEGVCTPPGINENRPPAATQFPNNPHPRRSAMPDTTVTKVDSRHSPRGPEGEKYLASAVHIGMRMWENEPPGGPKPESRRDYETVGYVISGRAELITEGQTVKLEPG